MVGPRLVVIPRIGAEGPHHASEIVVILTADVLIDERKPGRQLVIV
jgi:hypothetical protein